MLNPLLDVIINPVSLVVSSGPISIPMPRLLITACCCLMGKPFGTSNPLCAERTAICALPKFSAVLTITVYCMVSPIANTFPFTVARLGSFVGACVVVVVVVLTAVVEVVDAALVVLLTLLVFVAEVF